MKLRNKILYSALAMALSMSAIGLSSCGGKKDEPKIQDVHNVNLHILRLRLSSKDVPALDNIFFSIKNSTEGLIENDKFIPYGTELKNVQIYVALEEKDNKVLIAEDGKNFKELNPESKLNLTAEALSQIKLKVQDKQNPAKEYIYQLRINQKLKHPSAMKWTALAELTHINKSATSVGLQSFTYTKAGKELMALMTLDGNQAKNGFNIFNSSPANSFEGIDYSGVAQGTYFTELRTWESQVFTRSKDGSLYRLEVEQNAWVELAGIKAEALLGVLAPRTKKDDVSLALIVKDQDVMRYASYNLTTKKLDLGLEVIADMPTLYDVRSTKSAKYGSMLEMVAVQNGNLVVYVSTNGLDWALASDKKAVEDVTSLAILSKGKDLYTMILGKQGLQGFIFDSNADKWQDDTAYICGEGFNKSAFAEMKSLAVWQKSDGSYFLYSYGKKGAVYNLAFENK